MGMFGNFFEGMSNQQDDFKGIGRTNDGKDFMAVPREPDNETTPEEAEIIARNNRLEEIESELRQIELTEQLSKADEDRRRELEHERDTLQQTSV